MPSAATKTPPVWFLQFWEQNCTKLPLLFRGESMMQLAWELLGLLLDHLARYATTPAGMRILIAFAKIQATMIESQIIVNAPDPSPEQVAEAVERLAQRVKA
jgi:hypothetical protein